MTERPAQIISGIWIEIVHNLRGILDSIKGNTHQEEQAGGVSCHLGYRYIL